MREIRVLCLPSNIPDSIDIDVEHLQIGESLSVADIKVDDEIEILEAPEQAVASVTFIKEVELEAEVEEESVEPGLVGEDEDEGAEGSDETESEDGGE